MSWKYEVQVSGEGEKWHKNGVAFATKEEAEGAARDKMMAWMACTDTQVVESEDPVNYTWESGEGIKFIGEEKLS